MKNVLKAAFMKEAYKAQKTLRLKAYHTPHSKRKASLEIPTVYSPFVGDDDEYTPKTLREVRSD